MIAVDAQMTQSRLIPVALVMVGLAGGQQLRWGPVIPTPTNDGSAFTSVEALADQGPGLPARAFACGHFTGSFNIGPGTPLNNPSGQDGVVVRLLEDSGWDVNWKAHASSTGSVSMNDISISPSGTIYVCGTYNSNVSFVGSTLGFSSTGGPHGFVARLDANTGAWTAAFETSGIEPVSLVAGNSGDVFVTGPGTLAACYGNDGTQKWSTPVPGGTTEWAHIAANPSFTEGYVLTKRPHASSQDVSLTRINIGPTSGPVLWTRIMGSPGTDEPGGLDVGGDGDVRLTFMVDSRFPSYNGNPAPPLPNFAATFTIATRIKPDGDPRWFTLVGTPTSAGSMKSGDLDVDDYGNSWLAATFDGSWEVEGQAQAGNDDAALIAIDGAGLLFDFHRSTGNAVENPRGAAAPTRELAMIVGNYSGSGSSFAPLPTLPEKNGDEAFIAIATPDFPQNLFVYYPANSGPLPLPQIIDRIHQEGGQVYKVVEIPGQPVSVSAWVTPSQSSDILVPGVSGEPESEQGTNGSSSDAGWALGRLNDPSTSTPSPYSFTCPDTAGEVVVHLIDTAIDSLGGWFAANANLSIEGSTLIRGAGDPTRSSVFEHGTQMMSLIAGPESGAASGTPILLQNYDIYPTGSTTSSAHLADAILEVISVHTTSYPDKPGIICIASSSTSTASSATLSACLTLAASYGFPVVLSAGNLSDDAALYVPQQYAGTGVLCVGGSNTSNTAWSGSNYGTPLDLHAPGEGVRTVLYSSPSSGSYDSVDGTSASAALTAAIGAIHLSVNPWQSPAELEAAILADVNSGTIDLAQLDSAGPSFSGSFSDWASWHNLSASDTSADEDGDGLSDGLEYFYGLDPNVVNQVGQTRFSFDGTTSEFGFTLNAVLYDSADPTTLLDGTTWEVEHSTDLSTWKTASGTFGYGSPEESKIDVTLTDTPTDTECFLRLEVTYGP